MVKKMATREELGLTRAEFAMLKSLNSPYKIQDFVSRIPTNFEPDGDTYLSVREVLKQRRAHCIEGAFLAACALWVHGEPALVMHLDCDLSDYPHVIALFRRNGCWGALSKTNGVGLRYRDPIYRSLRELAISYFHGYTNRRAIKTLRSYSGSFDMRHIDPAEWVTHDKSCWAAHDRLAALRHYPLLDVRQLKLIVPQDAFVHKATKIVQYPKPKRK